MQRKSAHTHSLVLYSSAPLSVELPQLSRLSPVAMLLIDRYSMFVIIIKLFIPSYNLVHLIKFSFFTIDTLWCIQP